MKILLGIVFILVAVSAKRRYMPRSVQPFSQRMVNYINTMKSTWTAGHNFAEGTSIDHIRRMAGVAADYGSKSCTTKNQSVSDDLPEHFDARQRWPECPNIGRVEDQGNCGTCWAFSAAAAMSDRICIKTKGMKDIRLSAMDILGCCQNCSTKCLYGYPNMAWDFYVNEGVVTGGPYHSNEGCRPYEYYACQHHNITSTLPACVVSDRGSKCNKKCQKLYNRNYQDDKHYGSESYYVDTNEKAMRSELFNNGPIQAFITMYADIIHYKKGVYQQLSQQKITNHAVRIIGWGHENGVPYWLIMNSYNANFGDNGYFKIIRGRNECDVESMVTAGLPKLNGESTDGKEEAIAHPDSE